MWKGRTIRKIVAVVLAGLMTGMLLTACTENKNGQQDAAEFTGYMGNLCGISWRVLIDTDDVLSYNIKSYDQV